MTTVFPKVVLSKADGTDYDLSGLGTAAVGSGAAATATRIIPAAVTFTDASVSSAAGSSETVAAASATRAYLMIANPAATTWWINPSGGTAAANGAGCFELPPGGVWTPRLAPVNAVTGIGTASSKLSVNTG